MADDVKILPGAVKVTGGGTHVPGVPNPELYQLSLDADERERYDSIFAKLRDEGMGEGLPLHVLTVLTMELNRLRPLARTGDKEKARQFRDVTTDLARLTHDAEKRREARSAGETVPKLMARYMTDARRYIEEHVGEHTIKCRNCNSEITTDGLPLWAVSWQHDETGEIIYFKWSPEVMRLYNEGLIEMHQAAYMLRTSPKALVHTARRWKDPIRECDVPKEEELLEAMMARDTREWERAREDEKAQEETT